MELFVLFTVKPLGRHCGHVRCSLWTRSNRCGSDPVPCHNSGNSHRSNAPATEKAFKLFSVLRASLLIQMIEIHMVRAASRISNKTKAIHQKKTVSIHSPPLSNFHFRILFAARNSFPTVRPLGSCNGKTFLSFLKCWPRAHCTLRRRQT